MENIKMEKLKQTSIIPKPRYLGSVNLKIIRYSNSDKSEIFYYDKEKDIFVGLGPLCKNYLVRARGSCKDIEKIKQNQKLSNYRAKAKIKKLTIENGLKFHCVTTYKDSKENRDNTQKNNYRDIVLYDNKLFLKKLSYHLKHKLAYVAVPEFQIDRFKKYGFKFLHMHIALSELVDERLFWSAWNSIKCMECDNYLIKKTDFKCNDCEHFVGVTSVKNEDMELFKIANYFTKYFSKGFENKELNQRSFNQKRYLNSFGLKMPQIIDISISEKKFRDYILPNCDYVKSMGLKNDIGSRLIMDNDLIDKYLYGEKK
jgi:hypothetical protein